MMHQARIQIIYGSINRILYPCGRWIAATVLHIRNYNMSSNSGVQHFGKNDDDCWQFEPKKPRVSNSSEGDNLSWEGNTISDYTYSVDPLSNVNCDHVHSTVLCYRALEIFEGAELNVDEYRHPLVNKVCNLIQRRCQWTPKLEDEMENLLGSLQPRQVCAVLRLQDDASIALQFFFWADDQDVYKHDTIVYYAMLEIIVKAPLQSTALSILHLMEDRGISLHSNAFCYVMMAYSRIKEWKTVMNLMAWMRRLRLEMDLTICNIVIHALVKVRRLNIALAFLDEMQFSGIEADIETYNCVMMGYCYANDVEKALTLFSEMSSKGCSHTLVTYHTVIRSLCLHGRIKEVRGFIEKLLRDGNLYPDQRTFKFLINRLTKHGHGDEALYLKKLVEGKGFQIKMTVNCYCSVIIDLCKRGKLNRAVGLVNEMFLKGLIPNVVTYSIIVNGFCRVGNVDKAKRVFQKMQKLGCKPNEVVYTNLISGLCKTGKSIEAREMVKLSSRDSWIPTSSTYGILLAGFCREEKLWEACHVVREMFQRNIQPLSCDISSLLKLFCKMHKAWHALHFLKSCLKKGFDVDAASFSSVIDGLCKSGDSKAALSLLDDMYLKDKHPDVCTYTTLILTLAKKGHFTKSFNLSLKMLRKGIRPSRVTYMGIIEGYREVGNVKEMITLLKELLSRHNCTAAYCDVVEKLCGLEMHEEGHELLVEALGISPTDVIDTCHFLMKLHLIQGKPLQASMVVSRMLEHDLFPDIILCEEVKRRLLMDGKLEEADGLMVRLNKEIT